MLSATTRFLNKQADVVVDDKHLFAWLTERQAAQIVASVIVALTPRHRDLIILRYHHGWTFDQIGAYMGTSKQAAAQMHDRTLKLLQRELAKLQIKSSADVI